MYSRVLSLALFMLLGLISGGVKHSSRPNHRTYSSEERGYLERQLGLAKWLNWITGIAAALSLFGLYILFRTLQTTEIAAFAARDQAKAALDANQISEKLYISGVRPWVYLDQVNFITQLRTDNAVQGLVRFVFKNIGHSPAINVWVQPKLMILNSWRSPVRWPINEQNALCDPATLTLFNVGPVIFPDKTAFIDYSLATSAEELTESRANPNSKALMPYLVGCVTYRFTFSPEIHQTGFIFSILRKVRNGTGPFLSTESGAVEPDELILDPTFSGAVRIY